MRRFVAVDLETTGVNPVEDYVVEVGIAGEKPNGDYFETEFSVPFPEEAMSEGAAAVNGWGKRPFPKKCISVSWAQGQLQELLDDCHIVGKNPHFDEEFLKYSLRVPQSWHHRLVDVGSLAWGCYQELSNMHPQEYSDMLQPPNVDQVAEVMGVARDTVDGYHTALMDARWAYKVFRKVVPK